jgi:serine/threonine-protein kinase OSR1/STK39
MDNNNTVVWYALLNPGSLRHVMNAQFPEGLPEPAVASILKSVISGLTYLHEQHIIHK